MTANTTVPTCAACGATLPGSAAFCPTCGTPTTVARSVAVAPGMGDAVPAGADRRRILQAAVGESCEVRELIGRGGFAEVYAGWDVRLKRELAIKTIRADIASPSVLERFQREAEAVAKLRHPHIIPIYGVGEANGIAFFTMPRISGESLAAAIEREKRMGVGEACRILAEAAGALEEAHRAGVVHRDIKPENIMLEGRDRRALVMDFGIAKSAGGSDTGLTGTGMVMGTPQYMSPEQAAGDRELDHRSDQYSLAMIGYRMLTGRLPFEADSLQTLLVKQVTEQPEPLRNVAPEVPERVAAAIERALAKRPEDRFPSMADFAGALSSAREGATGDALRRRAIGLPERITRMRRLIPGWTHPLTLLAIASAIVFLLFGTYDRPRTALDVAGQRDEALFTTRSFLAARGITSPRAMIAGPESRAAVYDFLRETVGGDSAAILARGVIPIWLWHVRALDDSGRVHHVDVAPGARITRYEREIPDSASFAPVAVSRIDSLARGALASYGVPARTLVRRPDSTVTRRNRVDHFVRWRDTAVMVPFGTDSGFRMVSVRVSGDEVTDVQDWFAPARSFERRGGSPVWDFVGVLLWLLVGGLMVYALIQAIARQRQDAIQWRTGILITVFSLACLAAGALPGALLGLRFAPAALPQILSIIGLSVFFAAGIGILVVFGFVTGESLAAEADLPITDGIGDLARGRLLVPELATGAATGLAIGLIILGLDAVNQLVWGRILGGTISPELPDALTWSVPVPSLLLNLGFAVPGVVAILYAQALSMRWTGKAWVAVLAPAVLLAGLLVGFDEPEIPSRILTFVSSALVSFAVWRYGLVAGALALFLSVSAGTLAVFVRATGVSTGLIVAVAALAAPFLPGYRSWRRFRA